MLYETSDGEVRVDVRFERETVWLTQQQMAELFERDRSVITRHIRNVFSEGELDPESTSAKFAQVQSELFLLYLKQEGMEHRLNPQALTALTLLIAESAPAGKDLMVRLIINLLGESAK